MFDLPLYLLLTVNDKLACKGFPLRLSLHIFCTWEWLGPGGLPGLQNLWRVALRAAVGSTPIHSRLLLRQTLKVSVVEKPLDSGTILQMYFQPDKPLGSHL